MRKAFITNTFLIALLVASSVFAAPVRWVGNGHLYDVILVPEGITWTDANVAAQARGSGWHLATITSAEENAFVANLASNPVFWICCSSNNAGGPWLGGFKVGPRVGDYAWVTGEPFVYTKWGPLEPFGNGDRLAFFGYQAPTGSTWNDVRATTLARAYIIENQATAGSVSPSSGGDTGSVTVWITGNGFMAGATVKLSRDGEPDVVGDPVTMAEDGQSITTTFDLAGKARGLWDVVVMNPDGSSTRISKGFTIEEGRAAQLWVDIVGRGAIRAGREQTYWILYGNRGNVDVWGSHLFLGIPGGLEYTLEQGQPLASESTAVVKEFLITHVAAGSSVAIPLIVKAPVALDGFLLNAAISDNNEGFRFDHSTFARPTTNFAASTSRLGDKFTSNQSFQSLAALNYTEAILPSGTDAPPGYIDFYIIEDPEFGGFGEIGIRIDDNHVAWSYPGEGVKTHPFTDFKDGAFTLPKAKDSQGKRCNPVGSCGQKEVRLKHVFSVRPDREGNMPALAEQIRQELPGWLNKGFCDPMKPNQQDCASCVGLADVLLYPRGTPFGQPNELLETDDYVSYWLRLSGVDGSILVDNINEALLNPIWFDWWVSVRWGFRTVIVVSRDPNDKTGSYGVDELKFLSGEEPLRYAVFFENVETATAPAQDVVVTDQLDTTKMDLDTLSLGPISFGDKIVTPPSGLSAFTTTVDLRPDKNLLVKIEASLDKSTGLLTWRFTSLDPATGQLPDDPFAGFLPPNITPPEGDGSVLFTVMPKQDLPTGTEIRNQAQIVFDVNPPINTPEWLNTLDNTQPTSQVLALAATQTLANFLVEWAGTDVGAGIQDYTILVAENGGPFTTWLSNTSDTSATFPGQASKTYAFYSVARDQTGNLEDAPAVADTTTTVTTITDLCPNDPNKTAPGVCGCGVADTDSDGDGTPNCNDQCPNDPNRTTPGVEVCNGLDDNCNGTVDDGFNVGGSCTVGVGVCQRTGAFVCLANGQGTQCNATSGTPGAEVCNGSDDDCDGSVDEGVCAPVCVANVSAQVSVTRGGFRRNSATGRYVQQITLKNTGTTAIQGPVSLALDSLRSNATLFSPTGNTSCATPVSPYKNVNVGVDNVLSVGETVTIVLEFTNPTNASITYGTRVLGGPNDR